MFFDDRLATVLRQRAASEAGQHTQYRQLLDILGNEKYGRDQSMVAAAWLRLDALAKEIPSSERAKMIREPGWRLRSPDLAAHLAENEPEVASAALNKAELASDTWSRLIPRLPVRARGFLRLRRDLATETEALLERLGVTDRGLPVPDDSPLPETAELEPLEPLELEDVLDEIPEEEPGDDYLIKERSEIDGQDDGAMPPTQAEIDPAPNMIARDPVETGRSEISALVERIAQFKRKREVSPADADRSPLLPLGDELEADDRRIAIFGFITDAAGRIEWCDTEVAAMIIGTRLATQPALGESATNDPLQRAFVRRQPIKAASIVLAGADAIAGKWVVEAEPRFTEDGNFTGYAGRFRRPLGPGSDALTEAQQEADRIRQLLHELRTPVTAVQGYAEVIQQQLFGPAPHEYRALAAIIAADAARILAGFEELDRLARLETGASDIEAGESDLASLAKGVADQLAQVLDTRMAGIQIEDFDDAPLMIAIDGDETEALLWRFLATLGSACASGEMLDATLARKTGFAQLTCEIPAQLLAEEDVFAAEAKQSGTPINAGLFGAGFALRLARAEARAGGGDLTYDDEILILRLPLAVQSIARKLPDG